MADQFRICHAPKQNYALSRYSVHNWLMRANVNLDTDAYDLAVAYASAKGIPLGAAISELLRRAEKSPLGTSSRLKTGRRGYLVKARTGNVITPVIVREAAEDDLG